MFTLTDLSDPHLGPIPTPRLRELINKRGLGIINWYPSGTGTIMPTLSARSSPT